MRDGDGPRGHCAGGCALVCTMLIDGAHNSAARSLALMVAILVTAPTIQSQPVTAGAQYDVVSIKPNKSGIGAGGGMQYLPDGTFMMTNQPIDSIILGASPVPVREVSGLPNWAHADRYDIIAKPPAGSTREQRAEMMRNMFIERMKLVGHVEEQERTTFGLILARSDGRLGPQLKPSTLDCERPASAGPQDRLPDRGEAQNRCGLSLGPGTIVSGGTTIDRLVYSLGGVAGGLVNDRTGLKGWYAVTLRFAPPELRADTAPPDDAPQFVTALQEQLGLKLQPEKTRVPVFIIDHIEPPTPNDR